MEKYLTWYSHRRKLFRSLRRWEYHIIHSGLLKREVIVMATVARRNVKVRTVNRPAKTEKGKSATSGACVEVRLSNRDRNTLLSALNSSQPNLCLTAAAEKYKEQCA